MALILDGTNGETLPSWTTATRPASPAVGQMGYNTTTGAFDAYTAAGWTTVTSNKTAGSVLQVVNATSTSSVSSTSSTWVATGLTASITPTSATSKILVFGQGFIFTTASSTQLNITLYRNGSSVVSPAYGFGDLYSTTGGVIELIMPFSYLDSPSTTSSTTYTIYLRNPTAVGTAYFGEANRLSVITLMEIAA